MTELPPVPTEAAAPVGDRALDPAVLRLWQVGAAIGQVVLLAPALLVAALVGGVAWTLPVLVAAVGVAWVLVVPRARYDRWRWRLQDRALEVEHGVVWRQVRALPYFRIQHVDVEHGPLDRWLGLARLTVHTASVTIAIPGLRDTEAPALRAHLLGLVSDAVDEVTDGDGVGDAV